MSGAELTRAVEDNLRHLGLEALEVVNLRSMLDAQKMTPIVCVQNLYNVANRHNDALIDSLAAQGIAWVPFFPLGGFSPLQSTQLNEVAQSLNATPMQVALAWLLQRAPNILLIPGTSSPCIYRKIWRAPGLPFPPTPSPNLMVSPPPASDAARQSPGQGSATSSERKPCRPVKCRACQCPSGPPRSGKPLFSFFLRRLSLSL
ncbi:hypothetical protein SODG_006226 [Sodalis praecaptivus]